MKQRSRVAVVLLAFVVATACQLLFHAHVGDDHHHATGCADEVDQLATQPTHVPHKAGGAGAHDALLTALPESDPEPPASHENCARCVTPAAVPGIEADALAALAVNNSDADSRTSVRARGPRRRGNAQRGPPRA